MNLCEKCNHNKNNWCAFFTTYIYSFGQGGLANCTAYRKKRKEKVTNETKKKSIKQEKRLAKEIGAKRTPQSGAQDTSPSDMITGNYVIESKATKGKSISVKEEWLSSLKESPMHMGKIPTLILEFPKKRRYIVIAEEDFRNIIEEER